MELKVENICGLLIRSKLMNPDGMKAMYARWQAEAKDVASLSQFTRWLVAKGYVTEYQASLLAKGHADDFFLGSYKLMDHIGRGRMAGVYRAVHLLGQTVAIKVLPPAKAKDPNTLARFKREARMSVRLKHPNVVRTFQLGEGSNGVQYLVMEYLDGETLDEVLQRRKRLPPHEAVRLAYQTLQGLQHIHELGMIHRDMKPGNLMLVPARKPNEPDTTLQATVKILDIGLGRDLFEEPGPSLTQLNLTTAGTMLGTPDYMAPEQARNAHKADIRADIYSVGCVLYHMLTGQVPFPDKSAVNQVLRHANETAKPIRSFNPQVPDGLQQIVNWMMAKDPNHRYPTPERAGQALQVFLAAGADKKPAEEPPQLRRYLTWLDTNDKGSGKAAPRPQPAAAVAGSPAKSPGKSESRHRSKGKKHKRHKSAAGAVKAAKAPLRPEEFDVELVAVPLPPTGAAARVATKLGLGLTRRDWTLLGVGAGCVIAAGIVGMLLAFLFR